MREAIFNAELGDDVFGEDPTTKRLEAMAAERMGKEAAVMVASGTMANLVCVLSHCGRGEEVILGDKSHTFLYEAGGTSAVGGIHPHTIPNQPDGTLRLEDIEAAIRGDNVHFPRTRLICLENTHNRCGGVALTPEYTRAAGELAARHGLRLHLDGARIFNAAVAQGVSAAELAAPADSVTFCLSKGLCAPVGSLLCGSGAFIERAHRIRKQLGGGMRQAGVLAAAGIVALEVMVQRLGDDHRRARKLAEGLARIPGLSVSPNPPHTNMVYLFISKDAPVNARQLAASLAARGVNVGEIEARGFRLVTHYWIDDSSVERAVSAFEEALEKSMI
jgi:threonine aldolase